MRRAPAPRQSPGTLSVHVAGPIVGLLAVVTAGAGCKKEYPQFRVEVAPVYSTMKGQCGEVKQLIAAMGDSARITFLVKKDGKVTDFCDATFAIGKDNTIGPPIGTEKADIYLELFSGQNRVASGALLDVNPASPPSQPLRVYQANTFSCSQSADLRRARAFHTASRLHDGNVLFVGGLVADPVESGKAATEASNVISFYGTSTVELYDARSHTMTDVTASAGTGPVRAFHQATVLSTRDNVTRILLSGGVTVDDPGAVVAQTDRGGKIPGSFRFSFPPGAKAAPTELLIYDANVSPPLITRSRPDGLQAAGNVAQAAGRLPGDGAILAGGFHDTAAPLADTTLVKTTDGMATQPGALMSARAGATMVTMPGANGSAGFALLVGGLAKGGDTAAPFERIDLGTLTATAAMPTATMPAMPTWYLPTVVSLDPPDTNQPRLLIAGGLGVVGLAGNAANPPPDTSITMYQVSFRPTGDLPTTVLPAIGFSGMSCSGDTFHYKLTAWNAATRLPAGDRVLITGGTPRDDSNTNCRECEDSQDNTLGCGVSQSLEVSIPASQNDTPQIKQLGPLAIARFGHTQTLLDDGNVLVVGGITRRTKLSYVVAETEIFNSMHDKSRDNVTRDNITAQVDDPLFQVDWKAGNSGTITRNPAGLAFADGTDPGTSVRPCPRVPLP